MAKGKKCPQCNYYMFAQNEKQHPVGVDVIYECRSCKFKERVFEDK